MFNLLGDSHKRTSLDSTEKIDIDLKMTLKYATEGQNGQDY